MSYHRLLTATIPAGETTSTPIDLHQRPDYSSPVTLTGVSIDTINGNQIHFEVDPGDGVWREQYADGEELHYKVASNQSICLNAMQFQAWKRVRFFFTNGNNAQTQDAERTIQVSTRTT